MAKTMKGVSCRERNGVVYWYAMVDGQRVYCGKDEKGRGIAEAARSKYVAKRYENRDRTAGLKVKKAKFKRIKEIANWYMELPSIQEQKGYIRKVHGVKRLLAYWSDKSIYMAEEDKQERYRKWRRDQGVGDITIDFEIVMLGVMFRAAKRAKKIPADAVPGRFIILNKKNPRRLVTDDEYATLLMVADPDFQDVLMCGYESGMRSSEIAKVTAGQVHLNVSHISGSVVDYIDLGIFDTKNKTQRTVPVSPILKEVLVRRMKGLESDDCVFTDRKRGEHTNDRISRKMGLLCKQVGIPHGDKAVNKRGEKIGIVFHCLRHTRTSLWVEQGFSDEIVRRATGHQSLVAYQQYIKLDPNVVMRLVADPKRYKNGTKSAIAL